MRSRTESRVITAVLLILFGSVGLCAVIPGLEHVLNVVMSWVAGAVVTIYIALIVRDIWL